MAGLVKARAYLLLMESKAGSNFLFHRASLSENRFALFRTHSNASRLTGVATIAARNAPRRTPRPLRKMASQPVPILRTLR